MPTQLPSETLLEHFLKLPEPLRNAISSVNTADVVFEIGRAHKFTIEKIGILGQETGLVMSGIAPAKEFPGALMSELGISPQETNAIVQELNEKIFLPIREYLKGFHGPKWEEDLTSGTSSQALGTSTTGKGLKSSEQKTVSSEQARTGSGQPSPLAAFSGRPGGIADTIRRSTPPSGPEPLIINPMQRPMAPSDGAGLTGITNQESRIRDVDAKPAAPVEPAGPKEPTAVSPIIRGLTTEGIEMKPIPAPSMQPPMTDVKPQISTLPAVATPSPKARYEETKQQVEKELVEFRREEESGKGIGVRDEVLGVRGQVPGAQPMPTVPLGPMNQPVAAPPATKPMVTESSEPVRPSPYVIPKENLEAGTRDQVSGASGEVLGVRNQTLGTETTAILPVAPVTPPIQPLPPVQPPLAPITPPAPIPTPLAPQIIPPTLQVEPSGSQNVITPTAPPGSGPQTPNQNPAPNPIRIEKKIPKPPAPERYDADPYRESVDSRD